MANCTLNTLSAAAKCFDCLSATEKQALRTLFLAQAVAGLGGPDLTVFATRKAATACFTCEPAFRIDSMSVAVAQRAAINAGRGSIVNVPIATLRGYVKFAANASIQTEMVQEMYLRCLLNAYIGTGSV